MPKKVLEIEIKNLESLLSTLKVNFEENQEKQKRLPRETYCTLMS